MTFGRQRKCPLFQRLRTRLCARRAVTLLEVMLSMGILTFVTGMTFWFYSSSLATSRDGTATAYRLRLARVLLDRIATEIRQASVITADNRVGVRGDAERIWLSSYRVPSRGLVKKRGLNAPPLPGEYDLTKVEYKIARHPEILHDDGYEMPLGLARVEIAVPRPDSAETGAAAEEERALHGDFGNEGLRGGGGQAFAVDEFGDADAADSQGELGPQIQWEELYAPEIRYLRFCYYDGHRWWDRWDVTGENPLPQLVEVTIGFEIQPPFGEEFDTDEAGKINFEFCTCRNRDPVDCEPFAEDQISTVIRLAQADPLFRSRVQRESQAIVEELNEGEDEDDGEGDGSR